MITINGKEYRNLQEQVQKNMEDINELKRGGGIDVYTKEESNAIFQTKIGMELYATQQQLNLNIAATEARTDALLANKQNTLVSGTNIKTVNGNSLVGSGNIDTTYTAGYGIGIVNDVISIDQNTVATTSLLNGYIKDNDTNYSAIFRGKGVWVKAEGTYTSTSYGDGGIARSIPNQPGYTYTLPDKSGTFAMTSDIITLSGLTMYNYKITISGVDGGTQTARSAVYIVSLPYQWDYSSLTAYDIIRLVPVWSVVTDIDTTANNKCIGRFHWQTGTIAIIDWVDGTHTVMDFTGSFNATIAAAAPAHW